ncbi:hypothetical protein A2U01_0033263, partial [Trifolium medium]|nr:hypothetical protein [Trifolium medium]
ILDLELPADEYIDSDEGEENAQFKLDLNVPFRLEVEKAAKSNNMEAPTNHMNNFLYDLSMRTKFGSQNFHDDVFNKRQNLEGSSHNQLKDNEKKCDWKSSGLNGGLLDSFAKDILTEKQSVLVDSLLVRTLHVTDFWGQRGCLVLKNYLLSKENPMKKVQSQPKLSLSF